MRSHNPHWGCHCVAGAMYAIVLRAPWHFAFLAQLQEVQKSYCSHHGRTRSRSHSRHTLLKFSKGLYLDNQLSESVHTWTIGTK